MNKNHYLFICEENKAEEQSKLLGINKNFYQSYNYFSNSSKDDRIKSLKSKIVDINPNLIIVFDKEISDNLKLNDVISRIENYYYFDASTFILSLQKKELSLFFKYHAILKVTSFFVYFIDYDGKIKRYENRCNNSFYFVDSDKESTYKSIYGTNLTKVSRDGKHEDGFEGHLSKKDIFYFENIDKIRHSTFLPFVVLDIETNDSLECETTPEPVISISAYSNVLDEYVCYYLRNENNKNEKIIEDKISKEIDLKTKVIYKEFFDEKDMLDDFLYKYLDDNVILLLGWNIAGYDLKYLLNRAKLLGIEVSDWDKNSALRNKCTSFKDFIVFDALDYYRTKGTFFNKPPKYSLDTVYKFLFETDIGKIKNASNKEMWQKDLNGLLLYNIRDVQMTLQIIFKLKFLEYALLVQSLIPQDFDNVFFNSKTIENLLHHKYWKKNIYLPSKKVHDKKHYDGAIVFPPIPGLHTNVSVFDFSAMYTSIYITFNISPDTYLGSIESVKENEEILKKKYNFSNLNELIYIKNDFEESVFLPHYIKFGCLPQLEYELLKKRKEMQRERDKHVPNTPEYRIYEQMQATFKEILNSIYGVSSFEKFILFNQCISASITAVARELLKYTSELSKRKGYETLYGDTDSVFIKINESSIESVIEKSNEFIDLLNDSWSSFVSKFTNSNIKEEHLKIQIDFEKAFSKMLLTKVKKKYFGDVVFYKNKLLEKPYLAIVGFETRRDDTPIFFKKILKDVYTIFLDGNYQDKLFDLYLKARKEIKTQDIENLIIRLKISKEVYKNVPIHIRALKNSNKTPRKGDEVNMIYVSSPEEVLHYEKNDGKIYKLDYNKYINNFLVKKVRMIDDNVKFEETLAKWF